MTTDIHFVEALTVKAGDRLLLRVDPQYVTQEMTSQLSGLLNERYPDVDITVLAVPGQLVAVREGEV